MKIITPPASRTCRRRAVVVRVGKSWGPPLALLLAVASSSASALAHAPPQATGIAWSPGVSGTHAVVRTNRGLIFEDPRTGTFSILCGEAFGSTVTEIAPFVLAGDGALFVGSYAGGLQRSSADRCTFEPVTELAGTYTADVQSRPGDADDLFALALPLDGSTSALFNRRSSVALWGSLAQLEGAPGSLRVSAGDPQRVYVASMRSEGDRQLVDVLRSSDHGQTFAVSSFSLKEQEVRAFVLDAGQRDPDRVFLRAQTADGVEPERLLLSEDGGATFRGTLSARGPLSVVSTTGGDTVWAGGFDGLFRSTDGGVSFTRLEGGPERIGCLASHDDRLYACGYSQGEFGVLVSSDAASEPFTWFLRFPDVRARISCSADSDEGLACVYPFEDWAFEQLGEPEPGSEDEPPTGNAGEAPAAVTANAGAPTRESAGCSVGSASQGSSLGAAWVALALGRLARLARARRVAPANPPRRH